MTFEPIGRDVLESQDGRYRVWVDSRPAGTTYWGAGRVTKEPGRTARLTRILGRQFTSKADAIERCGKDANA